ncbi:MAG: hypothetical protein AAFV93_25410 [Chloroflexota bacterium]
MSSELKINSLKNELSDWTDIEVAEYCLARCIGLLIDTNLSFQVTYKAIFFTNNPVSNMLTKILDELVELGCLEKRDEPDWQYRWNPKVDDAWQLLESQTKNQLLKTKDNECS